MPLSIYYQAQCDVCENEEIDEFNTTKKQFKKMVEGQGWKVRGEKYICPDCLTKEK